MSRPAGYDTAERLSVWAPAARTVQAVIRLPSASTSPQDDGSGCGAHSPHDTPAHSSHDTSAHRSHDTSAHGPHDTSAHDGPPADAGSLGDSGSDGRTDRTAAMHPAGGGWFTLPDAVPLGTDYAFRLDGGPELPDPRSRRQPYGVHGRSRTTAYPEPAHWTGRDLRGSVLYEAHVGTFTPAGTLDSAIERLDHLVALGVDAIELMPLAPAPGTRGWGYDGVSLFAVHEAYGGPDALARFIDAAHSRGLGVILDCVFNHLGPAGNYLGQFGPYFTGAHETPWGTAVNLDQDGSREVRDFILDACRQWLVEVGADGLRLDAVHALVDDSTPHLLSELSEQAASWEREAGRPLTLIAESDLNDPRTVTPVDVRTPTGPGLGMDAQWADDVHHALHAWLTGEAQGYYSDFAEDGALATTLTHVFLHDGSYSSFRGRPWGRPVDTTGRSGYTGSAFVVFLEDHDQVGNRARGDRTRATIIDSLSTAGLDRQEARRRADGLQAIGATLYLLHPTTPMIFQGEEWGADAPFTYFTDHDDELGRLVTEGRTQEFAHMGWEGSVPDPQAETTFHSSVLDWREREDPCHAALLAWYRRLIELRRADPALLRGDLETVAVVEVGPDRLRVRSGSYLILVNRAADPWPELDDAAASADVVASFRAGSGCSVAITRSVTPA